MRDAGSCSASMADAWCPGFSPVPGPGTIFIKSKELVCDLKQFPLWVGSCQADDRPQKSCLLSSGVLSCLRRTEEFEAKAPNAAAPNARPRVLLSHLIISGLLPCLFTLGLLHRFQPSQTFLGLAEEAREGAGPLCTVGRQPAIEGSWGPGQKTAVTFTTAEKLAAGSPASFAEGTGWLGRQLLRGRCGRRRINRLFLLEFPFSSSE